MTDSIDKKSFTYLLNSTDKTVFSTQDFNKFWQYKNYRSLIRRISYLNKSGKLKKIHRGLYSIVGRKINELELANKVRIPSYLSFETVLYTEGLIFQWDSRITLAAKNSEEIQVGGLGLVFRKLKDPILLNLMGIKKEDNYYVASKERALLDMLYINPKFTFDNLRGVDFAKLKELLPIYGTKSIEKVVKRLEEHVRSY